jgi:AraC family transcriptional regulator, ethanolamine operon transcriptional activator
MSEPQDCRAPIEPDISTESHQLGDFDPGALAHVVNGAELEHRRLPGGSQEIKLLQCGLPQSILNRGAYSPAVLVNGNFSPNAITFGAILDQKEPTIVNGSKVRMGTLLFFPENTELCYRAWPNATWMTLVITRERFAEFVAENVGDIPDLALKGDVTFAAKKDVELLDCLRDLNRSLPHLATLEGAERLGAMIEHDLLARFANFVREQPVVKAGNRRQLRLCDEIMRDTVKLMERDPAEILDLKSMSAATGLSPRTLQRTFQAEFGLCPQEWLRVERLNRARKDLLHAAPTATVTQTATRWGFFHFGRFSQYYRELFGEKPSETLARRGFSGLKPRFAA